MGMQVADFIKADRLNRLNAVVNRTAEERAQRFLHKTLEVILLFLKRPDWSNYHESQNASDKPTS